jgi:hypothetical protein
MHTNNYHFITNLAPVDFEVLALDEQTHALALLHKILCCPVFHEGEKGAVLLWERFDL